MKQPWHSNLADRKALLALLGEVYSPGGVCIWFSVHHPEWGGLTYEEMDAAGRFGEVMATAQGLVEGVAT